MIFCRLCISAGNRGRVINELAVQTGKFEIVRPLPGFLGRGARDVSAHVVEYLSGDLKIRAWLYQPADSPLPAPRHPVDLPAPDGGAIIVGHGGIWGIPPHYDIVLRRLAKAGWTVIAPSYRGEDGSDGDVEFCVGEVDDMLACYQVLKNLDTVNPDNIWLMGSSHGAIVNLLAVSRIEADNIVRGVIGLSGVYDMSGWVKWVRDINHILLADPFFREFAEQDTDELDRRSVMGVSDRIKAPVLLVHGDNDVMVPPDQTANLAKAITDAGNRCCRAIIQPCEDHEFIWGPERHGATMVWKEIVRFLNTASK